MSEWWKSLLRRRPAPLPGGETGPEAARPAPDRPTLILHAGIHRTGTTSLQQLFAKNRAALAAQGVVYPGEGPNHQKLAWQLFHDKAGAADAVLALVAAAEAQAAATTDRPRIVLSAEDFAVHRSLRWLKTVSAAADTRVVFYLRRQDHWLMSWYNQHIKWPFDPVKSRLDPAGFLERIGDFHWIDYDRLLRRWCEALGAGPDGVDARGVRRVQVGILETGQVEDGTADFLARIRADPAPLVRPERRANDSLPVHMLEIARHFDLFDLKGPRRKQLLGALRKGLADQAPRERVSTVYSPAERMAVLERFAASNRAVAQRFFGREALFLEPAPAADAAYWRFPDVGRDALLDEWIAPVIRALMEGNAAPAKGAGKAKTPPPRPAHALAPEPKSEPESTSAI